MNDDDLINALRALGRRAQAVAPDPTAEVMARIAPASCPRRRRGATWGLVVTLAAGGTATAVVGQRLVQRWFDGAVTVERVGTLPAATPAAPVVAGVPLTRAAAERRLKHPTPTIAGIGAPDAVVEDPHAAGAVQLVWRPRPGLPPLSAEPSVGAVLTTAPEDPALPAMVVGKRVSAPTQVEWVHVRGANGPPVLWIGGAPHMVEVPGGASLRFRLGANVVLWSRGARLVRFESALGRGPTVALVRAMPPWLAPAAEGG